MFEMCMSTSFAMSPPSNPYPDSRVHGANMGPTWILSAPDGPHVGPINLAIRVTIAGNIEMGTQHCGYWCPGAKVTSNHSTDFPNHKVYGAKMGPTWVLLAPSGPHVDPMDLAIWVGICCTEPDYSEQPEKLKWFLRKDVKQKMIMIAQLFMGKCTIKPLI